MPKPIVQFSPNELNRIELNKPAFVKPVNHPSALVTNTKYVRTSDVMYIADNGDFVTTNTYYALKEDL